MDLDVALKIRADAKQMSAELRRGAERIDKLAGSERKAGQAARSMAAATDRAARSVRGMGGGAASEPMPQ